MTTTTPLKIKDLTTATALAAADMLPIWSVADQDTRKTTMAGVTTYVANALNLDGESISVEYLTGVLGYKARPSQPLHTGYRLLKDGIWYSPDWLVLVMAGQSNAIGVANSTDGPKAVNPNVFAWNNISAPGIATLGTAPFNTAAGAPNNIAFHQAARLSEIHQRPVMIITLPVSGSPIGSWFAGQANWDLFEAQINAALAHPALWGQDYVDVFSFHLGESAHDALQYPLGMTTFPAFIKQCQTRPWSSPDMVFVAGEMLRQEDGGVAFNAIEEWRRAIAGGDIERAFLASSEGLTVNGDGTNVHFNGASLAILGQRYAEAPTGARVSEIRTDTRDVSQSMIWKGQFYTLLADAQFGPSNVANQNIDVNVIRSDIPVVFEVNGVRTEVLTVINAASLLLNVATDARVRVWYPAAYMGDKTNVAERPGITFANPASDGTMRRLWVNPVAPIRLLFVEGHNSLQYDLDTAHLPQSLTGLRFKSVAKLTFNGFKGSAMPPALTLLDFSGTTPIPGPVRIEIDAENTLRAGAVSVTYSGFYVPYDAETATPETFRAPSDGSDAAAALNLWAAWTGPKSADASKTYSYSAAVTIPNGSIISGRLNLTWTGANSVLALVIGNDVQIDDLRYFTLVATGTNMRIGTGFVGNTFNIECGVESSTGCAFFKPQGLALRRFQSRRFTRPLSFVAANTGSLLAAINSAVTTLTLTPAGIGNMDYPTAGTAWIDTEAVTFTRAGDVLTIVRGALGTTAAAHLINAPVSARYSGGWIGTVDIETFIRGFNPICCDDWRIDNFIAEKRAAGASFTPGHNGILASSCSNGSIGKVLIEGAAEHAVRFGGAATAGTIRGNSIGILETHNTGGCALKINADVTVRNTAIGTMFGTNSFTASPGGNKELLRLSHVDGVQIGSVTYAPAPLATYSCQDAVLVNDALNVFVGSMDAKGVQGKFLSLDEDSDIGTGPGPGPVRRVHIGYLAGYNLGAYGFAVNMPTQQIEDIKVGGGAYGIFADLINVNSVAGGIVNYFELRGEVIKDSGAVPACVGVPSTGTFLMDLIFRGNRTVGRLRSNWNSQFAASLDITSINGAVIGAYLKPVPVTLASLPTAADAGAGAIAWITNATVTFTTANYHTVAAGGGANLARIYSNGANWLIG